MEIQELLERPNLKEQSRELKQYAQFKKLVQELRDRSLPAKSIEIINAEIEALNSNTQSGKKLAKLIKTSLATVTTHLEKELKIVTKNHYRNLWLAIGVGAFGVPLGVVFGSILNNMSFIGIGMPIGMAIGLAIGTEKDKKAAANGNQLHLEVQN